MTKQKEQAELIKRYGRLAEETEKPGAVCSDCGRTVTIVEYSCGESTCCKAEVVAEEEYGRAL